MEIPKFEGSLRIMKRFNPIPMTCSTKTFAFSIIDANLIAMCSTSALQELPTQPLKSRKERKSLYHTFHWRAMKREPIFYNGDGELSATASCVKNNKQLVLTSK
jgi:hypothetical protein